MMQLINAARHGDKDATERLFVGIYDIVRLKALKMSRESDSDDVAQDATLRMMRVVSHFRGNSVGEFMQWVHWQVRSVAASYSRYHRCVSLGFDPIDEQAEVDRLEAIDEIQLARRVDPTAVAYAEFRVEGYSDREIASGLGVQRSAIRCKVYRLRRKMVAA